VKAAKIAKPKITKSKPALAGARAIDKRKLDDGVALAQRIRLGVLTAFALHGLNG